MDQTIFKKRRKEFLRRIQDAGGGIVILEAGQQATRNGDVEHEFRQESNFYYLTGLEQAGAIAVFDPASKKPYTLFVHPRDPKKEVWVGPSVGSIEAVKHYGADQSFEVGSWKAEVGKIIGATETIWYRIELHSSINDSIHEAVEQLQKHPRAGMHAPDTIRAPFPIIADMRVVKSKDEIAMIQKAIDVTGYGLRRCFEILRPGLKEYHLRAEFEQAVRSRGMVRHAYPPIVASGAGTCILHNPHDRTTIKKDALVLIDAGAEWDYYAADITRTVPASGRFTKAQRTIYEIVLEAQERTIAMVKPGATWDQLETSAREFMTKALLKRKIVFPESRQAGSRGDRWPAIRSFSEGWFPHKLGHWLGMDVHDVGRYTRPSSWPRPGSDKQQNGFWPSQNDKQKNKSSDKNLQSQILNLQFQPGMVLTIEPGIYLHKSKDVAPDYWGIGIRIEDDILITRSAHQNLSEHIPKDPDVLERLIQKAQL